MRRLVLLPGMDGTGLLFDSFRAAAPPGVELDVVPLPESLGDYPSLAQALAPRVSLGRDTVLLAESFAGPLALRLAVDHPPAAVILINSFVRAPLPAACCRLATSALFRLPLPDLLLRHLLVGPAADRALLDSFRRALGRVPPRVLAARVRALASLDARADLAKLACPLLFLRGTADRLVGDASLEIVRRTAPSTVVRRIPGPHLLLQAAPAAAWTTITPFLDSLAAA